MKKSNLNRRLFLRGIGGAAVAAPFLATLGVKNAIGQSEAAPGKRVIIYFSHYGCITENWFPDRAHGPLTAADFEGKNTAALAPFAAKCLIPRGLRGMNEWTFGREFGQETDPHSQVMASYLTAAPVDRTSSGQTIGGGLDFDKLNAIPYGRSLDHAIADQLNPPGVGPLVAHFDGIKRDSPSTLSYSAPLEAYLGVGSPDQMFAQLTNLGADDSGGMMNEDTYRMVVRGEAAPDLVRQNLDWLRTQRMSQSDKDKLDHWAELIFEASNTVRSALCSEEEAAAQGLDLTGAGGSFEAKIASMMDLSVLNAMCNQNAIHLLLMPGNKSNYIEGVTGENHNLSHRVGSANMGGDCVGGVLDMLQVMDRWYAARFAHLVERMDSIQETEGSTLLDNSATIWMMEQSDGQAHNLNNMPILQFGGLGGYMKVGQAVNVEDGSETMSNGNSLAQCANGDTTIGGNEVQTTGTDNGIANVPMLKYFYTLMNGLGVKGNAEGFPEVGGTGKVTKYGWSDDQQQFAEFVPNSGQGIADKPQGTFIDEGELESLLA